MMSTPLAEFMGTPQANDRFYGVTIGIVTNNQDPQKLGRVKVRFPWLAEKDESDWARVLTPMAGRDQNSNQAYGIYCLPDVETEVLVAFEQGDIQFPYILGGLWSAKDTPPETNQDGKNNKRMLRSRSGHTICLDDTKDNERIEILDKSGKNSIVIDTKQNTIAITGEADISIQSKSGKLKLQGKEIELKADTEMILKANMININ